ncbi:MAG: type II 3-dehydroquinate dehydratase [Lachnospiraceae bacterium]|nr:type II 3-dehydroquinate dehydratase [Lachnospiraceae bacterium]MBO7632535.1 type II 3-dehydroquinate dehydratase [Lachnospiraceae bacterium]
MGRKILVVNGPNLNFLGKRNPLIYGYDSYEDLLKLIAEQAESRGIEAECFQSNYEGAIIDRLQQAADEGVDGVIINPGALTHYSYAIYDCLLDIPMPKIEVHLTDIYNRESFRRVSVTAPACNSMIMRLGMDGYIAAMDKLIEIWGEEE